VYECHEWTELFNENNQHNIALAASTVNTAFAV